ncbi:cytochrome-c peroxidase [Flavobacterium sp. HSC-61S13]|uniref:cytochrome-c peroxidase n=1 Tax=Flavobacterium sp. HSC-61S13 TaxID=2910963 RepID=UPI0020A0D2E5|nr:cytochrome c peroxidase [Flavobacterium sp. HSC-61S13]MCP1994896.1 cytochrome c peroxidase [Flavobacterium sp. HSC-61S13]
MKKRLGLLFMLLLIASCRNDDYEPISFDNPEIVLTIPEGFPKMNPAARNNRPTQFGVELGQKLFNEKRFSADNSISCSSCHLKTNAFSDTHSQAVGIYQRIGLRNVPPLQNLAFLNFYNWDGSKLQLENQVLVPIITHEEMNSSIVEVIHKIQDDKEYKELFQKAFGDQNINATGIYLSLAQYQYTLISANSKYDRVKKNSGERFTQSESRGYQVFQQKCVSCHSTELFTDQSFRNIGFPVNTDTNEAGRARVTGIATDYMSFRVPSLRNVEYTAPYGSFGQFATLKEVLDYFDRGVLNSSNLDPIFKDNGNRIPLSEYEKLDLIAFMKTLSDREFTGRLP